MDDNDLKYKMDKIQQICMTIVTCVLIVCITYSCVH